MNDPKYLNRNYEFVGANALTADKILVYNIRISFVSGKLSIRQIKKYFRKFGSILDVRFLEDNKKQNAEEILIAKRPLFALSCFEGVYNNCYIVKFENPKDAASVLKKSSHCFKDCFIRVDACGSLDQPDGQKYIEQFNKTFENISIAQNTDFHNGCNKTMEELGILTLNDDCLEHICKYLNLHDQIVFARTCQRFCDVFALISRVKHKHLHTEILEHLTQFQIRIFLQIVGPQIITLTVDFTVFEFDLEKEDEIFEFLGLFLTNVERLKIIKNNHHCLSKLIEKMPKLQELELVRCNFDDDFIKYLKKFENLRNLKLMFNSDVKGSEVQNLTGLDKLTIYHCQGMYPNLGNIFKSLTNLTYLDFKCNTFDALLNTEDYEAISEHLVQLTTLKINLTTLNFDCLAQLPKLKILEIRSHSKYIFAIENFFRNLAKFQVNQLEELGICAGVLNLETADSIAKLKNLKILKCNFDANDECLEKFSELGNLKDITLHFTTSFTDNGILKMLRSCLHLQRVSLMCSISEKSDLITRARKLLQEQRDRRHRVGCVQFTFICTIYDPDKQIEKSESSDVLKIINGSEDENEYDHEYYGEYIDADDDQSYYNDSDEDVYDFFYNNENSDDENLWW